MMMTSIMKMTNISKNKSMNEKKIPMRICIGCNEPKSKKELYRVVKLPDNTLVVDKTGKMNGRGAYICKNAECLDKAFHNGGFMRSFKMRISSDQLETIKKELENDR